MGKGEYRSRVYTDRPDYADFAAPQKFMAIESIIAKRMIEHPNACCSYSGGSDSDIMLDLIERVRKQFGLPPIAYAFYNTGIEMDATKRHIAEVETKYGKYRLRPLYYVSDEDKAWYKQYYGIRYSDAYEVYGLKRTGCCGCPISFRAVRDLEIIGKYEPNLVKAAWNVFGESYRYRQKYVEYKTERMRRENSGICEGQCSIFDDYE